MYDQHIILDFEMNPISKRCVEARNVLKREIIEIGAVKLNSRFEIVGTFSCFINPEYSTGIANYITKLTGIRNADMCDAVTYEVALEKFNAWIGGGKNRVYSWSNADLRQIVSECEYKNVKFPNNIDRWMDFQLIFPRLMGLNHDTLMSLNDAADWYGIEMDSSSAHRALYDAKITTEMIRGALTGEYREVARSIHKYYKTSEQAEDQQNHGTCLGDLFGDVFHNFTIENQTEIFR